MEDFQAGELDAVKLNLGQAGSTRSVAVESQWEENTSRSAKGEYLKESRKKRIKKKNQKKKKSQKSKAMTKIGILGGYLGYLVYRAGYVPLRTTEDAVVKKLNLQAQSMVIMGMLDTCQLF